MTSSSLPNISRGRMSDDVKSEIERLARAGRKPGWIAVKLNRHPATVKWHMLTRGLIEAAPGRIKASYNRLCSNGQVVTCNPWLQEHDDFITARRVEGMVPRRIAELLTEQFGIRRSGPNVRVRLTMLAAAPDDETIGSVS